MNAPLAVTISSVMIAFFMIADEELPHNDGIMRCIEVVAPGGQPRQPALSRRRPASATTSPTRSRP